MSKPILRVRDLVTQFGTKEGVVHAVNGVSFDIQEGEFFGIVGESGSGKSVTAMSILQLIDDGGRIVSGDIYYRGENLIGKSEKEMLEIRGNKISMIFQDPLSSLNPVLTVGEQIGRIIRKHKNKSKHEARENAIKLLEDVGIPEPESRIDDYPHQFSGGMRQRIMISMAISCNPDILIADEPTTALDVTIEAQIFDLLRDLQNQYGMTIILITHDLGVIAGTCDRVAVMYAGNFVERAELKELFENPKHPYTRGLLRSIPTLDTTPDERLDLIEGEIPDPSNLPSGCNFNPRCPHANVKCTKYDPDLREISDNHYAACIRLRGYGQTAPPGNESNVNDNVNDKKNIPWKKAKQPGDGDI